MGDGGPSGVLLPGVDGASVAWEVYGGNPQTWHTSYTGFFRKPTGALKIEPPTRGLESERQDI